MNKTTMPWRKQVLSTVLGVALVAALCPAAALADEPVPGENEAAVSVNEAAAGENEAAALLDEPTGGDATTTPPAGEQQPETNQPTTPPAAEQPATPPTETEKPAVKPKPKPAVSFRTAGKIPGVKAAYVKGGKVTGKEVSTKPLTYIKIKNDSKNIKGNITYKVCMAGKGWTGWKKNGQKAGNGKTKNAVQAIKIKLTGDLAKQYNVYYRAYVIGSGWTGWGVNGDQVGAPKVANIRAYQMKIVAKSNKKAVKSYKKKHKNLKVSNSSEQRTKFAMAAKAQGQASNTKWLILVDTNKNRVCVLKGEKGQWNVRKFFKCTSGAAGSRTVRGKFTIGSRGLSFGEDKGYSCWYWTQFHGNYLFHSVLYNPGSQRSLQDGRLGINASHGCVRLAIGNAKWINRNIPSGTKVWTY